MQNFKVVFFLRKVVLQTFSGATKVDSEDKTVMDGTGSGPGHYIHSFVIMLVFLVRPIL